VNVAETVHSVFRAESARIVARLVRMVRDIGLAEELAQDAVVAALEYWPRSGVPDQPGAWLMTTAKNRAINHLNRNRMLERKHEQLGNELGVPHSPDLAAMIDDDIGDDMLRLVFTACHPVLAPEARVALTLRLLGGLTTDEIARAFLVAEATVAQRIVRAKRALADANVPFEVPRGADRDARLHSVLEVIYLIFNEGYAASSGDDVIRPALCGDALRLAHVLAELMPDEPEVHGLVALLELHASRAPARIGPTGDAILLPDQDRARWDQLAIQRGLAALARAGDVRGPYVLQAEISACHARARAAADTDWPRIAALYGELAQVKPSPVVELNRAMAVAMADGPAAGLAIVDALVADARLASYAWLPSARAELLFRLGRFAEARTEYERAAALTEHARDRDQLLARARNLPER
jgi:RNA polymerase sigma factor (sigma-70 family)